MGELTMVTFFSFNEGGREKLREFQERAAPVFRKYGLSIDREFAPVGRGHLGPVPNTLQQPDLIQVVSLESLEKFQAYLADETLKALAPIRAAGLERMTATLGPTMDLGDPRAGSPEGTLHFVALATFQTPGGAATLEEFNRRGLRSGLFDRHGIRLRKLVSVVKTMAPVGPPAFDPPEMLVHFSVDDPKALPGYLADPEYSALAPLRDSELKTYFFFQGA